MTIAVAIDYTNYRGERAVRIVVPQRIWWGVNDYHDKEPQWFLTARELRRGVERDFAMKDIHSWSPEVPTAAVYEPYPGASKPTNAGTVASCELRIQGEPYPKTCPVCGLGPCRTGQK
jgi:hypothetical protein